MRSKEDPKKLSDEIACILSFLRNVKTIYSNNRELLQMHDRKTSDFNHALELENLNYGERAKLATKQRDNLLERRKCKDILAEYQPIAELLDSKEGTRFLNLLSEALGKVRKQEKQHETRTYHKWIKD